MCAYSQHRALHMEQSVYPSTRLFGKGSPAAEGVEEGGGKHVCAGSRIPPFHVHQVLVQHEVDQPTRLHFARHGSFQTNTVVQYNCPKEM